MVYFLTFCSYECNMLANSSSSWFIMPLSSIIIWLINLVEIWVTFDSIRIGKHFEVCVSFDYGPLQVYFRVVNSLNSQLEFSNFVFEALFSFLQLNHFLLVPVLQYDFLFFVSFVELAVQVLDLPIGVCIQVIN